MSFIDGVRAHKWLIAFFTVSVVVLLALHQVSPA